MNRFKIANPWSKYFPKRQQQVLILFLLVGISLRIINAVSTQFWRDEVYSLFTSRDNPPLDLLLLRHGDSVHPPFYYLFLHFWQKISVNPFFLRSTSLFSSLLIFVSLPVLAKKMFPKLTMYPFIVVFLFTFSKTHISLNTTLRPYSFEFFLMIVSLILFIEAVRSHKKRKGFPLGFSIINSLVLFWDYGGFWLILSYLIFSLYLLVSKNKDRILGFTLLKSLALTSLISSVWLPLFIKNLDKALALQGGAFGGLFDSPNPVVSNLWQLPFFAGTTRVNLFQGFSLDEISLATILLLLSLLGLFFIIAKNRKIGLFLIISLVIPVVFSFVFSLLVSPIFLNRNLIVVTLVFILGIAFILEKIFTRKAFLVTPFIIFWLVNFFTSFPGIDYVDPPYDWIKVTRVLSSSRGEKKLLITDDPLYIYEPIRYYSLFWPTDGLKIIDYKEALNSKATDDGKEVFLITTGNTSGYLSPGIEKLVGFADKTGCIPYEYSLNYMYFAECK